MIMPSTSRLGALVVVSLVRGQCVVRYSPLGPSSRATAADARVTPHSRLKWAAGYVKVRGGTGLWAATHLGQLLDRYSRFTNHRVSNPAFT